jgi:hypothetical protein
MFPCSEHYCFHVLSSIASFIRFRLRLAKEHYIPPTIILHWCHVCRKPDEGTESHWLVCSRCCPPQLHKNYGHDILISTCSAHSSLARVSFSCVLQGTPANTEPHSFWHVGSQSWINHTKRKKEREDLCRCYRSSPEPEASGQSLGVCMHRILRYPPFCLLLDSVESVIQQAFLYWSCDYTSNFQVHRYKISAQARVAEKWRIRTTHSCRSTHGDHASGERKPRPKT